MLWHIGTDWVKPLRINLIREFQIVGNHASVKSGEHKTLQFSRHEGSFYGRENLVKETLD